MQSSQSTEACKLGKHTTEAWSSAPFIFEFTACLRLLKELRLATESCNDERYPLHLSALSAELCSAHALEFRAHISKLCLQSKLNLAVHASTATYFSESHKPLQINIPQPCKATPCNYLQQLSAT